MLTWNVLRFASNETSGDGMTITPVYYGEGHCLHKDEKPTVGVFNGSVLREMDTRKIYCFDGESKKWIITGSSSGGGGGGGDYDVDIATDEEVEEALDDLFDRN